MYINTFLVRVFSCLANFSSHVSLFFFFFLFLLHQSFPHSSSRTCITINNKPVIVQAEPGGDQLETTIPFRSHRIPEMGIPRLIEKLMDPKTILTSKFSEEGDTEWQTYPSWKQQHPSAMEMFEKMMSIAKGKQIVVFLDYDGTLSPIVDDPDAAFMTTKMRSAVDEVGRCFPTSIISGRSRNKVYEFVQLDNIYYAGSHGMDIMAPLQPARFKDRKHHTKVVDGKGGKIVIYQPAQEFLSEIKEIKKSLKEKTRGIAGVKVEDNNFCMSVHYRNVHEKDLGSVKEEVNSVLNKHPRFHITSGKKVMEIRPVIDWDKGHAVEYIIESLGLATPANVFPIYIGDDRTDEDAFKVIQQMEQGYSIIVTSTPKDTKASYSLRDTTEVMLFLERLAMWKKTSLHKHPEL